MSTIKSQHRPPSLKLNPAAVRERAKGIPSCQEIPGQGEFVISFLVMMPRNDANGNHHDVSQQQQVSTPARVNVFVDSGTIGTCRVMNGTVRQSFRKNVNSLDVLERLLRHPEGPMEINESLIGLTDDDDEEENHPERRTTDDMIAQRLSSPTTIQKELELANVGLAILQGEREKLEKHLRQLGQDDSTTTLSQSKSTTSPMSTRSGYGDSRHPQHEDTDGRGHDESSVASSTSESSVHGCEFHFKLPVDVMKQVDQCLRDIAKMDKIVKNVATNGRGTVFLYGNGGVAYTPSIPKALYQKLRQLRSSSYASRPSFVALGTRDRYYVAFNDGTADWKGPHALDKILKKCLASDKLPRSVAFGSTYDTFFVVFHDGSWQYQGRGIPETLEEKLASRDDRADLVSLNLGPSGEWFLKAENGRMWWSGITQDLDSVLSKILKEGYLHSMDFGENGSYFVTYENE
ncbi:hypothetical protein IV203_037658 [Nitzschia inconspicua]|uniref:Uncharacterized protein n=1 Tax=Nitzschia inconspicua TaxID=303405 RepID=A0A9K3LPZ4_9STRA|nr:hypothetical protein IV203_037658 [Nitzschia inconspicua]